MDTVPVSRLAAEIALQLFEDVLNEAFFEDIAAVAMELREVLGLDKTTYVVI
jgi:hypothetical protein